jgi:glycosyltransferase involved in cell wall biosynthesis
VTETIRPLKIAIAVHGRFHAFDFARALLARGHQVTLLTNYPKWAVARFGIPKKNVQSCWSHGVFVRLMGKANAHFNLRFPEAWIHQAFGKWVAARLKRESWDVVHLWSSIAEESLQALRGSSVLKCVVRGSAHIRAQARLLAEEEQRAGVPQDQPSPWMIAREEREYALADKIVVISSFAQTTFRNEGVPAERVKMIAAGAPLERFRATQEVIEQRCERILSGMPLRVLNVGTVCFRKGILDYQQVIEALSERGFEFTFVGPQLPEAVSIVRRLQTKARFIEKQPLDKLSAIYAENDLFLLPTIEDGFPQVLAQAAAAGLPILTTPNGAGTDLVQDGKSGWVLPIRSPQAFIEKLRWCQSHREELIEMVRACYTTLQPRNWLTFAAEYEAFCWSTKIAGK